MEVVGDKEHQGGAVGGDGLVRVREAGEELAGKLAS
jgi:hypothetical protein